MKKILSIVLVSCIICSSIVTSAENNAGKHWNAVNRTGDAFYEQMLTNQLVKNKLTSSGTLTIRQAGGQ